MSKPKRIDRTPADSVPDTEAMLAVMKGDGGKETTRLGLATDTEFWFAVWFETREQKEAFLAALNWDVLGQKYLDGLTLAATLAIDLPSRPSVMRTSGARPDKKLLDLAGGNDGK